MLRDRLDVKDLEYIETHSKPTNLKLIFASAIKNNSQISIKGDSSRISVEVIDLQHPETKYLLFKSMVVECVLKDSTKVGYVTDIALPFKSIVRAFSKKKLNIADIEDGIINWTFKKKAQTIYELVRYEIE